MPFTRPNVSLLKHGRKGPRTKGAFMVQSGPWTSCQIVKTLIIALQIIPRIEGPHFSGHSNVCSGLGEEEREARPTTLRLAEKEVPA